MSYIGRRGHLVTGALVTYLNSGAIVSGASYASTYVGNRNLVPYTNTTATNRHQHIRIKRWVAKNADYSSVTMNYGNWFANSTGEGGTQNQVWRSSIFYGGTYYRANWSAVGYKVVNSGTSTGDSDVLSGLTLLKNTEFEECIWMTLPLLFDNQTVNFTVGQVVTGGTSGATGTIVSQTDSGASGSLVLVNETGTFVDNEALTDPLGGAALVNIASQNFYYTGSSKTQWREGVRGTQDSSINWLASSPVTYPVYTANMSAGNIASVTKSSGGTGWTVAPNLVAYEVMADGRLAVKVIGYGNLSAGTVTSGSVTSGTPPAGFTWTSPTVVMVGGSGFGTTSAVMWSGKIKGVPNAAAKSVLFAGDSIGRGDSSADSTGDIYHNFGIYEQGLANLCGVVNMSTSGGKASYYRQESLIYPLTYAYYKGTTTHAVIALGTNDIVFDTITKANLESNLNDVKVILKTGITTVVDFADYVPRTTSSDLFATEFNQTVATGFGAAGVAVNTNADISTNTTLVSDTGTPLTPSVLAQGTDTLKWRVNAAVTDDGTHWNILGIASMRLSATWLATFARYA